ncbi:hypothetical protein ACOY3W_27115, partial [Klebsiella pneumoniae]|uniref:hypothetical protein n=1 Tax=Klebsiella pneumoniae TaxID=573 RepID=UPI003BCE353A
MIGRRPDVARLLDHRRGKKACALGPAVPFRPQGVHLVLVQGQRDLKRVDLRPKLARPLPLA